MGIEPFLVASSLVGLLAQRLVRRLCPECRVLYKPTDEELRKLGIDPDDVLRRHAARAAAALASTRRRRAGMLYQRARRRLPALLQDAATSAAWASTSCC